MDHKREVKKYIPSELSSILRVVLSSIGGSAIATAWAEIEQKRFEKNIILFIDTLKARVDCNSKELDKFAKNIDEIKNICVIFNKTIERLSMEWEEAKISKYANLAWNCMFSPVELDRKVQLIEQFSHLSMKDIEILQEFEDGRKTLKECSYCHYENDYLNSIVPSVVKLTSSWLLEEADNETAGFTVFPQRSKWESKCYQLTPYGQALIKLIQDPS